ncbi:uncharacterized protein TRAVEDRAFT_87954, partial [Trametes versicolor FP-101664 SS1]|uniref:uncharacterized protein n=1 Tax=Trametes versicolor (strain FP-101664) TaxID=717944 RepID=UPI0004621EE6
VPGMRLEHAFESLSASERDAIARQLKGIFTQLRGLTDGQTRLQPFDCDWTRDEFLAFFDLNRTPMFSHGDLTPWNIMVHNGRISGVVDWAEAGWYPYFWDSFVLERAADRFWQIQGV